MQHTLPSSEDTVYLGHEQCCTPLLLLRIGHLFYIMPTGSNTPYNTLFALGGACTRYGLYMCFIRLSTFANPNLTTYKKVNVILC